MSVSEKRAKAARAEALLRDETFIQVMRDVTDGATALFLDPSSDNFRLSEAHERIRLVHMFRDQLQSWISDAAIADKREKAQHRGND